MPNKPQTSPPWPGRKSLDKFATQAQSEAEQPGQVKPAPVDPPPVESPPRVASPLVEPNLLELQQQQLEGIEGVDIQQFTGVSRLRKAIQSQSKKLDEKVSTQQYVVFKGVTEVDFAKIDSGPRGHARLTYWSDTQLLVAKMPTYYHEVAHRRLGRSLEFKLRDMGMAQDALGDCGSTRYKVPKSSKEGDTTFKPRCRNMKDDWPTVVFEAGLSESLRRLRQDAKWWLENSSGEVKIVILISIRPAEKALHIEKWELAPLGTDSERRSTRSSKPETLVPTQIQELTILTNSTVTVTESPPLVLRFQDIFLRPAVPPECDIMFTAEDLSAWADDFWETAT